MKKLLDPNQYNKIIFIQSIQFMNIRNVVANYFAEGQWIFYIDDDIYRVYECIWRKSKFSD